MKRYLLFTILILLLLPLNACTTNTESTPTSPPNPTADAASSIIFNELNMAIETMEITNKNNQLVHINGLGYQVTGVAFPQENNLLVFRVQTRCECAENGPCCNPIQTFAATMGAMDVNEAYQIDIIQRVQSVGAVNVMEVWCYDHATLTNKMSVPWPDVVSYLQDNANVSGFQLWAKVTPDPQP
jgi:hypothetical protein